MADEAFVPGSAAPNVVEFHSAQTRDQAAEIRALSSVLIERFQFLRQAGITFGGLRDTYELFGYSRTLTIKEYRDRYSRGGIAGRICDCFPNATWRGEMEIIEDEDPKADTTFEAAVKELNTRLTTTAYFRRADTLSQLGYYAVILLGAPGDFTDELPRAKKPEDLKYISPFSGGGGPGARAGGFNSRDVGAGSSAAFGDATILSFDTDAQSDRFGLPLMYQLRRIDATSPDLQRPVHWSRIIHLAEGCLDNEVYGLPRLERVWNLLDDLDKVTGGGAESYFQKAKAGLHVDVDKTMGLPGQGSVLSDSERARQKQMFEDYKHEISSMLFTRGTTVKELGSSPSNFNPEADAIITQVAGALSIPKRILTGSEMGELASSQDRDNWKDQIDGRQKGYAEPYIVRRFYDRLIKYGYLPTPKKGPRAYTVKWPHIQVLTEAERSAGAKDWASVNATQGAPVFTENEIREHWYQLDPLSAEDEADGMSENQKGQLAVSLAMTNKSMGVTVFTDDEIREKTFGLDPLTPEEKLPIAAPERLSGGVGSEPGQKALPLPPAGQKQLPADTQALSPPPTPKVAPQSVAQMHAQLPQKPLAALETAIAFGKTVLDVDALRTAMENGDTETTSAVLRTALDAVTDALRAGEASGHEFHGNQYTTGGALTEHEHALQQRLVDFKTDRSLTGPGTQPITTAVKGTKFTHYMKVPGLDVMHKEMGVSPTLATHPLAYQAARDTLFAKMPQETVPFSKITFTQPRVNIARYQAVAKSPPQLDKPVQMIKHNDRYYVMNGHHRAAGSASAGRSGLSGQVFDTAKHTS